MTHYLCNFNIFCSTVSSNSSTKSSDSTAASILTPLVERSRLTTAELVDHYLTNCQGGGYWQPFENFESREVELIECIRKVKNELNVHFHSDSKLLFSCFNRNLIKSMMILMKLLQLKC